MTQQLRLGLTVANLVVILAIGVSLIASQTPSRMPATPTAAPSDDTGAVRATVGANTAFAMDLYRVLLKDNAEQNLFLSPFSISTILGLATDGARGATATQMRTLLHISDLDTINAGIASISHQLGDTQDGRRPYQLYTANAIWGSAKYPVVPAFKDLSRKFFDTDGIRLLNFSGDPEGSRATINGWVEDQTKTKIKDLLPSGSITPLTAVVLTNAIYFKGAWWSRFEPRSTTAQPFHVSPEKDVPVAMMRNSGSWQYFEDDDVQAVRLPYKWAIGGSPQTVSMLIVLPKKADGLATIEQSLTPAKFNEWIHGLQRRSGSVLLPKFRIAGATLNLTRTLPTMGMVDAFNQRTADFSALVTSPSDANVFITGVFHKAFIDVDEEGTEAAAATAVAMGGSAAPQDVFIFRADHPFFFAIRYEPTNSILFMGRVTEPSASAPGATAGRGRGVGPVPAAFVVARSVPQAQAGAKPAASDAADNWSPEVQGVRGRLIATPTQDAGRSQVRLDLELENVRNFGNPIEMWWKSVGAMLDLSLEDVAGVVLPRMSMAGNEMIPPPYWLELPFGSSIRILISKAAFESTLDGRLFLRPTTFQGWLLPPTGASTAAFYLRGNFNAAAAPEPRPRYWLGQLSLPRVAIQH